MKKTGLVIITVLLISFSSFAQNTNDALRYSQIFYGGTARFMSMGGAFTALGGDISSLSQNPAGLGVFRSSEITVTPQLFYNKTSAGYKGITSDYLYNFNLSQAGIVSNIITNSSESGLLSLNFGYSFNKTNNLNSSVRIQGVNDNSSMADYWVENSNGYFKNELLDYEPDAYLANRVWIIDTISGYDSDYGTVLSTYGENYPTYGQTIRRTISNTGYTAEHAFSIGGNYSNKIYFGATLGISRLNYTGHYEHLESDNNKVIPDFNSFNYVYHLEEAGTGFSLKIGTIYKPVEFIRLGFAFHSPVLYRIHDYLYDNITSSFDDGFNYSADNSAVSFDYKLTTPFRALAGVAVQIKKLALLSADYEFVDYSTARFTHAGDDFNYSDNNLDIKDSFKSTSNLRLGAEFRINKMYLRGGYGYYGKAYKKGHDNQDLDYNSISFGFGLREQNVFFDFGFTNYRNSQKYFLYPGGIGYEGAQANLSSTKNMFTITAGYKFAY
jgi:long-subunit fatty acid transport protein